MLNSLFKDEEWICSDRDVVPQKNTVNPKKRKFYNGRSLKRNRNQRETYSDGLKTTIEIDETYQEKRELEEPNTQILQA